MAYRTDVPALEERRALLWGELEEARRHSAALAASAAREDALAAELAAIEARLVERAREAGRATESSPLDRIRIASPCKAAWDDMAGDERVRFCGTCAKNVYDLSAMERAEAEALLATREGSLCVRLARRADGTVITSDCPVGARKKRVRLAVLSAAGAGALAYAAVAGAGRTRTMGALQPMPMGRIELEHAPPDLAAPPPAAGAHDMGAPAPGPRR
jgi:hypothetical protein